jgi:hypothetical protein
MRRWSEKRHERGNVGIEKGLNFKGSGEVKRPQRGLPGGRPPARVQGAAPAEPVDEGNSTNTRVQGAAPAEPVDEGNGTNTRVQGAAPAQPVDTGT